MKRTLITHTAKETEALGERIGARLRGGEVIELVSDLGGGKTTFVRGLTRGFGSSDRVASPSFTLSREYAAGSRRIHHFDFYRLPDAGIMRSELAELIGDPERVVVIEWADVVRDVLPLERLSIKLAYQDDESRQVTLDFSSAYEYLVED